MKRFVLLIALVTGATLRWPSPARSDDFTMALSAEAKAAHGIKNRKPVDVSDTFKAGERVWIWSLIKGGEPGSNVTHVWSKDGVVMLRREIHVGDRRWSTNSRHVCEQGTWDVQVLASDGTALAEVIFTVE
jgi:hypothetical protein